MQRRHGALTLSTLLVIWLPQASFASTSSLAESYRSENVPSCAIAGVGYDDPVVTAVNGGVGLTDSTACQVKCAAMWNCSVFTYYLSNGGCWLQGAGLAATPIPGAIGGPRVCDVVSVTRPIAMPIVDTTTASLEMFRFVKVYVDLFHAYHVYLEEAGSKHLVRYNCAGCPDACSDPIEVSQEHADSLTTTTDFNCAMLKTTTTQEFVTPSPGAIWEEEHTNKDKGAGIWPWFFAILLLFLCCLICYFYSSQQSRKSRKHRTADAENQALMTGSSGMSGMSGMGTVLPPFPPHMTTGVNADTGVLLPGYAPGAAPSGIRSGQFAA